jgi:hypothetical protein
MNLEFPKINNHYDVIFMNGVKIGEICVEADGYYVFWSNPELSGFWDSAPMRVISDKLDELNKDWDQQVHEYFNHNTEIRSPRGLHASDYVI